MYSETVTALHVVRHRTTGGLKAARIRLERDAEERFFVALRMTREMV